MSGDSRLMFLQCPYVLSSDMQIVSGCNLLDNSFPNFDWWTQKVPRQAWFSDEQRLT